MKYLNFTKFPQTFYTKKLVETLEFHISQASALAKTIFDCGCPEMKTFKDPLQILILRKVE